MTDRDFYRMFAGLLGALIALSVVLFVLAMIVVSGANLNKQDPAADQALVSRIKPVGEVSVGAASVMDGVVASANANQGGDKSAGGGNKAAAGKGGDKGEATYNATCATCHTAGVAGAPKLGDKAAWKDRIAKGDAAMTANAIKGFQGKSGFMPPKGGNAALSDADVKAAVDYMVKKSK